MTKLVLIRGIPGSGKSTFAKSPKFEGYQHFETDMFWEAYRINFDYKRLGEAHRWCQDMVSKYLAENIPVVVSNTFVRQWEMEPYLDMTKDVTVYRMTGEFKNIHGVPDKTVRRMKHQFEDYEGEILV